MKKIITKMICTSAVVLAAGFQVCYGQEPAIQKLNNTISQQATLLERLSYNSSSPQKDSLVASVLKYEGSVVAVLKEMEVRAFSREEKGKANEIRQIIEKRTGLIRGFEWLYSDKHKREIVTMKEFIQYDEEKKLFAYRLNANYYFNKAELLYQSGKLSEAGRIFYKLQSVPGEAAMQKSSSERLATIEAKMYDEKKDQLLGTWSHFDRKYTCYGQIGINPVKAERTVIINASQVTIMEKDSCLLKSGYDLQPVFDWQIGSIGYKLNILATREEWRLSINEFPSKPLSLWVHYPPREPYTTSQPYDVYEKKNFPLTHSATVKN